MFRQAFSFLIPANMYSVALAMILATAVTQAGIGVWTEIPTASDEFGCVYISDSNEWIVCSFHWSPDLGDSWVAYDQPGMTLPPVLSSTANPPRVLYFDPIAERFHSTTDFGVTWLFNDFGSTDLQIDVESPNILYGASFDDSFIVSSDYGETWATTANAGPMRNIAQSQAVPDLMLATAWGSQGYSILRSLNRGQSWTVLHDPFPDDQQTYSNPPIKVGLSPLVDSLAFLVTRDQVDGNGGRLWRSVDAGTSWLEVDLTNVPMRYADYDTRLFFHPSQEDVIYWQVAARDSLWRSTGLLRSLDSGLS